MKRREFMKLSTGALTGLAVVQGANASLQENTQQTPRRKGTSLLRVLAVIHPLDLEYRFNLAGHFIWVDLDLSTGEYEVCGEFDQIHSHPMANWISGAHHRIPNIYRTPGFPQEKPVLPDYWLWPELVETYPVDGFWTADIPRFVKATLTRDIARWLATDEIQIRDRRDDFDLLWADWDLATGEWNECAVDDPIYDSVLCHGVTPEYEKWEIVEMMSKEEIEAFFKKSRG
ncbi:MAG: hypothetical protein NXH81_14650 [Halieaceae bacterium]|uniref:hypothetical protein n=1 Tax=Haliea alexandrii TaxID=2448162 RepID=UPI001304E8C5|nr:hypothetical protein [Haliea alexandrii]MCR9186635.1 hypothetical protein [Halieaceae bacterium]